MIPESLANRSRRRGTVYIIVLASMSIVMTISLSGLVTARTELAAASRTDEEASARSIARSALEIAVETINADPAWRESVSSDILVAKSSLGDGAFHVTAVDPDDGDLLDDYTDPVVLTAIAQRGQSTQKYSLRMEWATAHDMTTDLILSMHPLAYWPLHGLSAGVSADERAVSDAAFKGTLAYNANDPGGNYDMPEMSTVNSSLYLAAHDPSFETDFGTVAFWVNASSKYSSSALSQVMFSKFVWDEPDAAQPVVMCLNGGIFLVIEINGAVDFAKFGSISGDTWHHVAITWGDAGWTAYFDGVASGSIAKPMGLGRAWTNQDNTSDIMFGAATDLYRRSGGGSGIDHHFNGKICEAAFFAYELSVAQIKELAKSTPTPLPMQMDHASFTRVVD